MQSRRDPDKNINRLYVAESTPSSTGFKSRSIVCRFDAGEIEALCEEHLRGALGVNGVSASVEESSRSSYLQ